MKNIRLSKGANSMPESYPHNTDIEQSVLTSIMFNLPRRQECLTRLKEKHFYSDRHKTIYRAINRICDQTGEPGDLARLADELKKSGELENVGATYLSYLMDHIPMGENFGYYIDTLENLALKRGLFDFANIAFKAAIDDHTAAIDDIGKLTQTLIDSS